MFHDAPRAVLRRMEQLEEIDRTDKSDGTPHHRRLRQVPPETGRFIALMASLAPAGTMIEVGTSAGYSSLWLSLACHDRSIRMKTYETQPEKLEMARETFRAAGVDKFVELIDGDGLRGLEDHNEIAFCFLDADKAHAVEYWEKIEERLVPGGLFLADNAVSHRDRMGGMLETALTASGFDSLVVPIGKGVLVCRKSGSV